MKRSHGLSISLPDFIVRYEVKNISGAKCAGCKKVEAGRVYKIVRISDLFSLDPAENISISELEKKTQKILRSPVGQTLCADCVEKILTK